MNFIKSNQFQLNYIFHMFPFCIKNKIFDILPCLEAVSGAVAAAVVVVAVVKL